MQKHRQIGQYTLIRRLGMGGSGTVYLAESEEGRSYALKILHATANHSAADTRFRYEIEILSQLQHPNIVRVFNFGKVDDEFPYFVMEYVDGTQLNQFLTEQSVTTAEIVEMFWQICKAIELTHSYQVLHRDLKPAKHNDQHGQEARRHGFWNCQVHRRRGRESWLDDYGTIDWHSEVHVS